MTLNTREDELCEFKKNVKKLIESEFKTGL